MHKEETVALLVLMSLLLVGCTSKQPTVSENVPTISVQQASVETDYATIYPIGQFTGFVTGDSTVKVYPYYNIDKYVELDEVKMSQNNFWYDFVTDKGLTMGDVTTFDSGVQQFTLDGTTYGFLQIDSTHGVIARTSTLLPDYVKLVLEHID